ncbi:NUDIX domain-containing protein [Clostridium bovifaecis]|uniref:NUDIX domain-containing protein n=1 Tax=Clostridium bovifaecis TaxID=2184719 RepID=A0A6I6FD08_9CLOT|nr:NUDIX domain-containing protein [Clostridium bovifaecis]
MENIEKIFKDRKSNPIGKFHKSAVMILLLEENNELYVLFEKRALNLRKQPGDISFPGGAIEEGESPREAAIRETEEELNINREDIEVIGEMDYFISPYNSVMFPFVGKLKTKDINPSEDEVDHVFKVPLKFFLENEPIVHEVELRSHLGENFPFHFIHGGKDYKFMTRKYNQYFYVFGDYVIWGFTAQVVKRFIEILLSGGVEY